jgi:hypothetical protein
LHLSYCEYWTFGHATWLGIGGLFGDTTAYDDDTFRKPCLGNWNEY